MELKAKMYAILVRGGRRTLDSVPEELREEVRRLIDEVII